MCYQNYGFNEVISDILHQTSSNPNVRYKNSAECVHSTRLNEFTNFTLS